MAMIEIMNPTTGRESTSGSRNTLSALSGLLDGGDELKVSYLSNGKPNTRELFSLVDDKLGYGHQTDSRLLEKNSAAHAAPDSMVADVKRYADLAVIGTAD